MVWLGLVACHGVVVWRDMGLVRRVGWHGGGLAWHVGACGGLA